MTSTPWYETALALTCLIGGGLFILFIIFSVNRPRRPLTTEDTYYIDRGGVRRFQRRADLKPIYLQGQAGVIEGSAIAEQRRYGRERGSKIIVTISPADITEYETMVNAEWLLDHQYQNGVEVRWQGGEVSPREVLRRKEERHWDETHGSRRKR